MSRRLFVFIAVILPVLVQVLLAAVLAGALFGEHIEQFLGRLAPDSVDQEVRRFLAYLVYTLRPNEVGDEQGKSLIFGAVGGLGFLVTFSMANIWATFVPILLARRRLVSVSQAAASLVLTCIFFTVSHSFIYQIGHICELLESGKTCTSGLDSVPHEIGKAIFLSVTMMTSLGFGDYLPGNDIRLYVAGQSVAGLLAISAVVAMATAQKRTYVGARQSSTVMKAVEVRPTQFDWLPRR